MANNSGGGKFGSKFKQTAGQVRKEIEFKNALMRHLAEKCAAVENDSSNSEDELTAKEGLQIEASRDELLAQLEADAETRKFRERQALSHAVRSQHMELLLRRSLEEVRQKRKQEEVAARERATSEATDSDQSQSANGSTPSKNPDESAPSGTDDKDAPSEPTNRETPGEPANTDESCKQPIDKRCPDSDVTDASSQSQSAANRTAPALSGSRRAASVEEGNVECVSRIKLAQTRNNSFGQTPTPPHSAPANKTQRFDYV